MPEFKVVGKIELSNTKHSYKVYLLDNGKWVFYGLIKLQDIARLHRKEVSIIDICAFSPIPTQQTLNFNLGI